MKSLRYRVTTVESGRLLFHIVVELYRAKALEAMLREKSPRALYVEAGKRGSLVYWKKVK